MNRDPLPSENTSRGRAGAQARYKQAQKEAAQWLALREARAFTAAEHASFADWMARDPRHAAVLAEVEAAWRAFDGLAAFPHCDDRAADPDLLAPAGAARRPAIAAAFLAAASIAVAALVWYKPWTNRISAAQPPAIAAAASQQFFVLPDGTVVETNAGATVEAKFTPAERRVVLARGEAHFAVAHNPARPFIVEARGVAVRAVGTAFNVRLAAAEIEVLVTEGRVQVAMDQAVAPEPQDPAANALRPANLRPDALVPLALAPGQRTVIGIDPDSGRLHAPVVEQLALSEIDRKLAWQKSRLVFDSTPLAEAIARIERHATLGPRLVLGDDEVGKVLVSGRIWADRVESFVEALEFGFGVSAERRASGEIVLRKRGDYPPSR